MQYMLRPLCSILVIAAAALAVKASVGQKIVFMGCTLRQVAGWVCHWKWLALPAGQLRGTDYCLVQRSQLQHNSGHYCAGSGCLHVALLACVLSLGIACGMRCWPLQCHQLQPGQIVCMWHALPAKCSSSACGMRWLLVECHQL